MGREARLNQARREAEARDRAVARRAALIAHGFADGPLDPQTPCRNGCGTTYGEFVDCYAFTGTGMRCAS